eukprot:scaffold240_cov243-Pinguiococcus_pyrenoidosus.AAC.25
MGRHQAPFVHPRYCNVGPFWNSDNNVREPLQVPVDQVPLCSIDWDGRWARPARSTRHARCFPPSSPESTDPRACPRKLPAHAGNFRRREQATSHRPQATELVRQFQDFQQKRDKRATHLGIKARARRPLCAVACQNRGAEARSHVSIGGDVPDMSVRRRSAHRLKAGRPQSGEILLHPAQRSTPQKLKLCNCPPGDSRPNIDQIGEASRKPGREGEAGKLSWYGMRYSRPHLEPGPATLSPTRLLLSNAMKYAWRASVAPEGAFSMRTPTMAPLYSPPCWLPARSRP